MTLSIRTACIALLLFTVAGCGRSGDGDATSPRGPERAAHGAHEPDDAPHSDSHGEDVHGEDAHGDDAHGDDSHADAEHDVDRVYIDPAIARESGIRTAVVASGTIRDEHEVQGVLTPVEGKHASVVARFPGPIVSVHVGVGDAVRRGQTLALVESNVSLSGYAITSPMTGVVTARNAAAGDMAGDAPLFEIADLSTLWVDLHVFGADAGHLAEGQGVHVRRLADGVTATTALDRVLPNTATESQSTVARATIDNLDGQWRPGAAVSARVTVADAAVAIAIPQSALQSMRDATVAFVKRGDGYEARALTLGRRDATHVEVLAGLHAGDEIVVEQSFLIKADLEKSGAGHDH